MINKKSIKKKLRTMYQLGRRRAYHYDESMLMLLGKQMSWQVASVPPNADFRKIGYKVFSQWDEDGIIQYLISKIPIPNKTFIEFGVENYEESNTRFLLLNDHWRGLVLDGCAADIHYITTDPIHWEYDLQARSAWITRENIDSLLQNAGFGSDVGLLSIDIDGNDYWIWDAITSVRPRIVIVEYSSIFGLVPISIRYQADFNRTTAHYSNLYYGCSLAALYHLARQKGYLLLGSNVWGHNAFFVREDVAGDFRGLRPEDVYVESKFRESRDRSGKLTYARGEERIRLIEDMPVVNVVTGETGPIREFRRSVSPIPSGLEPVDR